MRRSLAAAALCLAVAGCAAPQTEFLTRNPGTLPLRAAVPNAVFFAQKTGECGPAALAMILAQSGVPVRPGDLDAEVYNPGREGSLAPAVLAAARRHDRIAYPISDLSAVLREIADGRPVLVLQNLSFQWYPLWHYAVAVRYDLTDRTVTLHSGTTRFLKIPLETFEHTWARSGYWGLVALRPGQFPDPVDEKRYVRAVAGVERAGDPRVAARGYRGVLERWPDNLVARMGLGNTLYRLGDRRGAAAAYREAARRHPAASDAYNNLAQVLFELGDVDAAERAARRAIAIGGPNLATYRETLRAVQDARARSERTPRS